MVGDCVTSTAVLVAGDGPEVHERASVLGARLGIDVVEDETDDFELLLAVTAERLELRQPGMRVRPVFVDFNSGEFKRRAGGSGRRSLLGRAIGFKGQPLRVVDATAGLGRDAMVMALLGCEVTAVERDNVVFSLLQDGLARDKSEASERVRLVLADAVAYLGQMGETPDVVYLDPMFPARKKSALPGRELQVLARLVGHGGIGEAEVLLEAALVSGAGRVVVKRSDDGAPLAARGWPRPDVQVSGRTVRFDVYLRPGAKGLQDASEARA